MLAKAVIFLAAGLIMVTWSPPYVWCFTTSDETALRTQLFTTNQYDVSVRPNESTVVSLSLVVTSLNSIDIKTQTMSISGWWIMSWSDSRLQWDPTNFAGIDETHVFEDNVWTPTIVVYNSINNLGAIDEDTIPIVIKNSGNLEWSPPGIITVSCDTDVTHFPFDKQTCGVSVKTFGYRLQQLALEADDNDVDLTYYTPNGEWELLTTSSSAVDLYNYSLVTFNFKYQRMPDFYGLNLILPVLMMAVMGLFIFLLPADSGEKMGYSLTVMLTFVVLMTLLSAGMPTTTDHTSFFEVYVVLVLTMCALSVILSIFSLNLYFKDESEPIPARAKDVARVLMRLMCQKKHNQTNTAPQQFFLRSKSNLQEKARAQSGKRNEKGEAGAKSVPEAKGPEEEVTWKKLSMLLDAFCFRVYIAVLVIITIVFLSITASN